MTAIACVPDSGLGQAEERVTMVTGLALQTVGMRQLSTHTGTLPHLIRGELHGAVLYCTVLYCSSAHTQGH